MSGRSKMVRRGTGRWPLLFDLHHGDAEKLRALAHRFNLHQLAVDDCLSPYFHTPELEEFDEYLFIILGGMAEGPGEPQLEELDVFLSKQFVITSRQSRRRPSRR